MLLQITSCSFYKGIYVCSDCCYKISLFDHTSEVTTNSCCLPLKWLLFRKCKTYENVIYELWGYWNHMTTPYTHTYKHTTLGCICRKQVALTNIYMQLKAKRNILWVYSLFIYLWIIVCKSRGKDLVKVSIICLVSWIRIFL